jgi:Protein of unknown function (DUF3341)
MTQWSRKRRGLVAEFKSEGAAVAAATTLAKLGYRQLDNFVPRPVDAFEERREPERSTWRSDAFHGLVVGTITGLALHWLCNGWDSVLYRSGAPPFGTPTWAATSLLLMLMFAVLNTSLGALQRTRRPAPLDPIFEVGTAVSPSVDHYWVYVNATDQRFRRDETERLMHGHGCVSLSWVASSESQRPPSTRTQPLM